MKRPFPIIEQLITSLKEYINTRLEILQLLVAEKVSMIVSTIISGIVMALIFGIVLLFASFAGAYALSDWLGHKYIGFLIIAVLYLIIGIIFWLNKEKLIRVPIMNQILRQLFKNYPSKNGRK